MDINTCRNEMLSSKAQFWHETVLKFSEKAKEESQGGYKGRF